MFTAALFVTANSWKEAKCSLFVELLKKQTVTHPHHGTLLSDKQGDPFMQATAWMHLEVIAESKRLS